MVARTGAGAMTILNAGDGSDDIADKRRDGCQLSWRGPGGGGGGGGGKYFPKMCKNLIIIDG